MANKNNDKEIYCSFCGKPQDMVSRLIAGSGAYICDRCVELCMNIIEQSGEIERDCDSSSFRSRDVRGGFRRAFEAQGDQGYP